MGTHPSGHSHVQMNGETIPLREWLSGKPNFVGVIPQGYSSDDLPFLFKVLSVQTALSIQAHPDKQLAARLFATSPHLYKDPNHKPEMAVALTPFRALCGFRTVAEIQSLLPLYPEALTLLPEQVSSDFFALSPSSSSPESLSRGLRSVFSSFMKASPSLALSAVNQCVSRLSSDPSLSSQPLPSLLLSLHVDFPGDIGVFCPLLLNVIDLQEGEAFFMGANTPHAYLSGDCVECMALSDNVLRAGLTPKFKDVEVLCAMLHYESGAPSDQMVQASSTTHPHTYLYRPPPQVCAEFEVERIHLPPRGEDYSDEEMLTVPCGSILLCTQLSRSTENQDETEAPNCSLYCEESSEGHRTVHELSRGDVFFVAANSQVKINVPKSGATFYRAHCNLGSEIR